MEGGGAGGGGGGRGKEGRWRVGWGGGRWVEELEEEVVRVKRALERRAGTEEVRRGRGGGGGGREEKRKG